MQFKPARVDLCTSPDKRWSVFKACLDVRELSRDSSGM